MHGTSLPFADIGSVSRWPNVALSNDRDRAAQNGQPAPCRLADGDFRRMSRFRQCLRVSIQEAHFMTVIEGFELLTAGLCSVLVALGMAVSALNLLTRFVEREWRTAAE